MKIEPLSLTVRELCNGYADHAEDGVVAYGGSLDIRPKYQREFIYSEKQQKDEFYTRLEDIERELAHYQDHFRGKTVLCNCDDPRVSNFFHVAIRRRK